MEGIGAQEDYKSRIFMIDYGGKRRIIKPTPLSILKAERLLDQESGFDPELGPGANTLEELEEEMAEDAIDELEKEMEELIRNGGADRQGKA